MFLHYMLEGLQKVLLIQRNAERTAEDLPT